MKVRVGKAKEKPNRGRLNGRERVLQAINYEPVEFGRHTVQLGARPCHRKIAVRQWQI